mmetsp:Transcript_13318/g.28701  ORF Transcript_13318/g.28701 Transcript_13318/m.28701 type:complete len:86 (+) Transcript_13318:90-347(+)
MATFIGYKHVPDNTSVTKLSSCFLCSRRQSRATSFMSKEHGTNAKPINGTANNFFYPFLIKAAFFAISTTSLMTGWFPGMVSVHW